MPYIICIYLQAKMFVALCIIKPVIINILFKLEFNSDWKMEDAEKNGAIQLHSLTISAFVCS